MATYVVLADVEPDAFQNAQELASIWGEIEAEIVDQGAEPGESYAIAGEYDFLLTYDAEDTETAMKVAIAIERHGLDTRTMPVVPVEALGEIVDDV